jgi:hypothetical protein
MIRKANLQFVVCSPHLARLFVRLPSSHPEFVSVLRDPDLNSLLLYASSYYLPRSNGANSYKIFRASETITSEFLRQRFLLAGQPSAAQTC